MASFLSINWNVLDIAFSFEKPRPLTSQGDSMTDTIPFSNDQIDTTSFLFPKDYPLIGIRPGLETGLDPPPYDHKTSGLKDQEKHDQ